MRKRAIFVLILSSVWLPVLSQEVGKFAVVQNRITSLKPGAATAVEAHPGASIVIDELEQSGPGSAAKMTFGEGAVISIGQNTDFQVTQFAVDEASGASVSKLDLAVGSLRVFVSRFWGGRPEVDVDTPTAVVGIKGSEVHVEVLRSGATVVTVLTGSALLRPKDPGEPARTLGAAQQQRVDPAGRVEGNVAEVDEGSMQTLWNATEPDPQVGGKSPGELPLRPPQPPGGDDSDYIRNTTATSSQGETMGDPSTKTVPESVDGSGEQSPGGP